LRAARYGAMAGIAITPLRRDGGYRHHPFDLPTVFNFEVAGTSQPPFDKHDTDLYKLVNRSNNALEKSVAGPDM
jgi:hypothetical protein